MTSPIFSHPRYEKYRRSVELAAVDAGLCPPDKAGKWAKDLVLAAYGSETRGHAFPWYETRARHIHAEYGGKLAIVQEIGNLALGLLSKDPDLDPLQAAFEAGNEWRQSIRSHFDHNSGGYLTADLTMDRPAPGDEVAMWDWLLGEEDEYPSLMGNDDARLDEVRRALRNLPEQMQKAVVLHSNGMTFEAIAEEVGYATRHSAWKGVQRAIDRMRKDMGLVEA